MFLKVSSKATLFFLALVFSVAVSGGCGGGGGGHYYGDYGNSSQDVTPEPQSQDVTPESVSQDVPPIPEPVPEPVSNDQNLDEYGANDDWEVVNFTYFDMLNNTEWDIESIKVIYNSLNGEMPIRNTLKVGSDEITINKLKLMTSNGTLFWSDGTTLFYDDLTISTLDYFGDGDNHFDAPILRTASDFKEIDSSVNSDSSTRDYRANTTGGEEILYITKNFPTQVVIVNTFSFNNRGYTSYLTLKASQSDRFFNSLNNTNWKIKSVQIVGANNDTTNYPVNTGIYNYNVGKITLRTNIENNVRVLNFTDEQGRIISNPPLMTTFSDNRLNVSDLVATILRPASDFKSKGKNNGYEVFEATLPLQNNQPYPDIETLYISQYGPNSYIQINNGFYSKCSDGTFRYYWAILVLEPYKGK